MDTTEAELEQRARDLVAAGWTRTAIARALNKGEFWISLALCSPEEKARRRWVRTQRDKVYKSNRKKIQAKEAAKPERQRRKRPEPERQALIRDAALAFARNEISRQELSQRLRAI